MLVQDDKEIPICRLNKRGKVEIVPLSEENAKFLLKENPSDIYQVFADCVNNNSSAWYFGVTKVSKIRYVRLSVVSAGRILKNEIVDSYRERYDKDLEMAQDLRYLEGDIFEPENK